jgi:hypothetical protein
MKHMALALMLIAAPALGATRTDTTVAFYHGEPDRAGNYIVPGLNWQSVGAAMRWLTTVARRGRQLHHIERLAAFHRSSA